MTSAKNKNLQKYLNPNLEEVGKILNITNESHQKMSTRQAFGQALCYLGKINSNVVVLDADLAKSTKTDQFATKFPERFFNIGIAEQDMVSIAAGLASCKKQVIVSSFAIFLTGRALDQIRNMIALNNFNVILVGSHAGLATGEDGATHQALEDLAVMRTIPNMKVYSPSDAYETFYCLLDIMNKSGPSYLRLSRPDLPIIQRDFTKDHFNHMNILHFEAKADCAIFSTGIMVDIAIQVRKELLKEGFCITVINVPVIKPIDIKTIKNINNSSSLLISLEDHSIIGGLGSTIAEILADVPNSKKLIRIGVNDEFGTSGSLIDLFKEYGLDSDSIKTKIIGEIKKNGKHEIQ